MLSHRPDGIYVANHLMTVGLLKAAEEMGLMCPDDFGLVSFDDYPWLGVFRPKLTTVELPKHQLGSEAAEGGDVEVIVVIVALEDEIDFRKMLKENARGAMAFRAGEGNWAGAFGPDGIAENVDAVHLDEDRGVADESDADGSAADAVGRDGAGGGGNIFGVAY